MDLHLPCTLVMLFFVVLMCNGEFVYNREFQLNLQPSIMALGRENAIDVYCSAWSEASGLDYRELIFFDSIRDTITYQPTVCGSDDFIRQRIYVAGDLEGLVTVDIKTPQAQTQQQAESQPFAPAASIADVSVEQIEYDIHTCDADYSANTRVFLNEEQTFENCEDIFAFFPNAVTSSSQTFDSTRRGIFEYSSFKNGTYLDGIVSLDMTMQYRDLESAIAGTGFIGGEFSYTMITNNGDEFSTAQTTSGIEIYEYLLDVLGSYDEEYPCLDGTTTSDFFPDFVEQENSPETTNSPSSSESSSTEISSPQTNRSSSSSSSSSSNSSSSSDTPSSSESGSDSQNSASNQAPAIWLFALYITLYCILL